MNKLTHHILVHPAVVRSPVGRDSFREEGLGAGNSGWRLSFLFFKKREIKNEAKLQKKLMVYY